MRGLSTAKVGRSIGVRGGGGLDWTYPLCVTSSLRTVGHAHSPPIHPPTQRYSDTDAQIHIIYRNTR